jgi:hypothetical protein
MAASGRFSVPADTRRQTVSFLLYFVGALAAGFAVHFHALVLIFLPLLAVGGALASQLRGA